MSNSKQKRRGQANTGAASSDPRHISNGPYLWITKSALHCIRDTFGERNQASSAIAVFTALCELASDAQSESFNARINQIAERSGLSYRSVTPILETLVTIRLIDRIRNYVDGTKELAPNTYTLLCVPVDHSRSGNNCRTLGNGSDADSLPRNVEESLEESPKETPTSLPAYAVHHSDEWRGGYSDLELEIIDMYHEICVPAGFLRINKYSEGLSSLLERFENVDETEFRSEFTLAAGERVSGQRYTGRLQNKLIRILPNMLP